jgi:hypothetical protein
VKAARARLLAPSAQTVIGKYELFLSVESCNKILNYKKNALLQHPVNKMMNYNASMSKAEKLQPDFKIIMHRYQE